MKSSDSVLLRVDHPVPRCNTSSSRRVSSLVKRYQTHAAIGFLRALDDSLDVNGLGIRRTVLWNDANGSPFVLGSLPQLAGRKLLVEDLTG